MSTALPTIVLLSLDTTRVDALSCYGVPPGPYQGPVETTPHLDALAAEGIRFEKFYANAPSTLSSHTTMLTGLDPHGHAVARNGFPVDPDLATLPERLQGQGYDTIAVLGAAALESAMGLDRGFRLYDDAAPELRGLMYQDTAEGVVARTLAAVDARPDPTAPLFLLVHFYDPHTPYEPPDRFATRFSDPAYTGDLVGAGDRFKALVQQMRRGDAPTADVEHANALYLGEVAYVDEQIGELLDGLGGRGLLGHALVVAVADHGETLSDEPIYAYSHGSNVAPEVMQVPLIVRGYGLPLAERAVVRSQASMDGLAPTLERVLGLEPTLGTGLDFYDLLRAGPVDDRDGWPEPTLPAYVEATRPRGAEVPDAWNNLRMHRGLWAGGWAVVGAPFIPEPFHFQDVGAAPHSEILDRLVQAIAAWDARAPEHVDADMAPATRDALKALGYLD